MNSRPHGPPLLLSVSAAVALLCSSGCVTPYHAFSLRDEAPAHRRSNVVEPMDAVGLRVAATLLDEAIESAEYFDYPLTERGIVGVVLHFENVGSRRVAITRDQIRLILPDGERTEFAPIDADQLVESLKLSQLRSYLLLPLVIPFLINHRQTSEFNFELAQDYKRKALPDYIRVVPEDDPFSQVVFFEVGPAAFEHLQRDATLAIPIEIEEQRRGSLVEPGAASLISIGLD